MWSLSDYRTVFVAVGLIGVLVCCVPSVMLFARLPAGEDVFGVVCFGSWSYG